MTNSYSSMHDKDPNAWMKGPGNQFKYAVVSSEHEHHGSFLTIKEAEDYITTQPKSLKLTIWEL